MVHKIYLFLAKVVLVSVGRRENRDQGNVAPVYNHFASVREVNSDTPLNVALHLPDPPAGTIGMTNEHSRG